MTSPILLAWRDGRHRLLALQKLPADPQRQIVGSLDDLATGLGPCGKRGEFHMPSYAGPLFRHPLTLHLGESVLRDERLQLTNILLDTEHAPAR